MTKEVPKNELISEFNLRKYQNESTTLVDGTEYLANVKQQVISFRLESTGQPVYFKAFITTFTDTYSPNYNSTQVFGRTDPIHVYQNTSREISLAFDIPAASEGEAFENLGRLQKLIRMLYPGYASLSDALTLTEAPLVRIKVMNLLSREDAMAPAPPPEEEPGTKKKEKQTFNKYYAQYRSVQDPSKGTLGVIKSCTFQHNLENPQHGVFPKGTNAVLPKTISVSISFTPFHEQRIGRSLETTNSGDKKITVVGDGGMSKTFPYGVDLGDDADDKVQPAGASRTKAEELKRTAEKARREAASTQNKFDKEQAIYARAAAKLRSASAAYRDDPTARNKKRAGKAAKNLGNASYEGAAAEERAYNQQVEAASAAEEAYQDYIQ
jgi:hypothetical protein